MSADLLRQAAKVLRERAEAATSGPWRWDQYRDDLPYLVGRGGDPATYAYDTEVIEANHAGQCGCRSACYLGLEVAHADRDYIATMHPGVGLALADWLDIAARRLDEGLGYPGDYERPLTIARLILGGAS